MADNDEVAQKKIEDGTYDEETFIIRVEDVDVPEDGRITLFQPIRVNDMLIVFKRPVDDTTSFYNVTLEIHACFEPIGMLL